MTVGADLMATVRAAARAGDLAPAREAIRAASDALLDQFLVDTAAHRAVVEFAMESGQFTVLHRLGPLAEAWSRLQRAAGEVPADPVELVASCLGVFKVLNGHLPAHKDTWRAVVEFCDVPEAHARELEAPRVS